MVRCAGMGVEAFDPASCRAPSLALANEAVVIEDGPHLPVELVTVAARPEPASSSPAVPTAKHSS